MNRKRFGTFTLLGLIASLLSPHINPGVFLTQSLPLLLCSVLTFSPLQWCYSPVVDSSVIAGDAAAAYSGAGSTSLADDNLMAQASLCGSGAIVNQRLSTPTEGGVYSTIYDFSRGVEQINSSACGREYPVQPNSNQPNYGTKLVYLVDGFKRRISSTQYVEAADGSLSVLANQPMSNRPAAASSNFTIASTPGTVRSLNDGTGITNATSVNSATRSTSTSRPAPSVSLPPTINEQAYSADAFVNSLGVNVHLTYTDTAYGRFDDLVKPKLLELGVRHIRDGGFNHPVYFDKLNRLAAAGIKSNLYFNNPVAQAISITKQVKNAVESIEGPNETDLTQFNKFVHKGKSYPAGLQTYQNELFEAVNNDPETRNLTVVMPSMGHGENALDVGYLSSGDVGNMHSYPNLGNPPADGLDTYFIPNARVTAGITKPLWSTETGYHNLISDRLGISENASRRYIPRLWLEQFNRKIGRIFLYELFDLKANSGQAHNNYGLLRADGSTKPAYTALKNMIGLLKEPGASFTPGKLSYSLSASTDDIHHTLLQKKSGEFYLILWQDAKSWDRKTKQDVSIPKKNLTINLTTAISQAVVYEPMNSSRSVAWSRYTPGKYLKQMSVSVGDHPLIVKLKR